MKKRKLSHVKLIILYASIYVGALILGFALCLGITYSHSKNTPQAAMQDMAYYSQHMQFSPNVQMHGAHNYVYNTRGERIDYSFPDIEKNFNIDPIVQRYFHEADQQSYFMKLIFQPNLPKNFGILVVLPMDNDNYFVFFRELSMVTALIIIFVCATVMLLFSVIFTALIIRNNKKAEQLQQNYVANISHELKSPIASVRAITETIRDGMCDTPEQQEEYCNIMLHELYQLEHTVVHMLELSRIQSLDSDCSKERVLLSEVFATILSKYKALCYEMEIQFDHPTDEKYDILLYTNKNLASRLLDILLDNALKYTEPNGCIQLRYEKKAAKLIIHVSDTGPGIPVKEQHHIFLRFYKGDTGQTKKGSGLGLAIASEIAQCLDEKVWLNHSSSQGSEFCFSIELG